MLFPISPVNGSCKAFSIKVWQYIRLVRSENSFRSKSREKNVCCSSIPSSSSTTTAYPFAERKALDSGNDDFRLSPLIALFFVNHTGKIVFEIADKVFPCLVFQFQAVNQKQHPLGISCF